MLVSLTDIRTIEFPDLTESGVFHFQSLYNLNVPKKRAIEVRGFGSGQSRIEAAKKSVFELLERIGFHFHRISHQATSSNGFAAHATPENASLNSVLELVERDVFFRIWFDRISPRTLQNSELPSSSLLDGFERHLAERDLLGQFKMALNFDGIYVVIGIVIDPQKKFGGFVTSAASYDLCKAVQSSILTMSRYLTIIEQRRLLGCPLFTEISMPACPSEHFEYYLNPAHQRDLLFLLQDGTELKGLADYNGIEVEEFGGIKFPFNCFVTRAFSPMLQNYFVGAASQSKLSSKFEINRISRSLHPLP